jgi:hypothetical protein
MVSQAKSASDWVSEAAANTSTNRLPLDARDVAIRDDAFR